MWWSEIIIPLFIPLAIIMIIIYLKTQRIYTLCFSLSALVYIMGVLFTIDEFELEENATFLILIFSAILMVVIGIYLTHAKKKDVKKKR